MSIGYGTKFFSAANQHVQKIDCMINEVYFLYAIINTHFELIMQTNSSSFIDSFFYILHNIKSSKNQNQ